MEHLDTLWKLAKEHPFLATGVVILFGIEMIHRASLIVDLLIALVRGLKGALRTLKRKIRKLSREVTQWDPLPEPDDEYREREPDKRHAPPRAVEPSGPWVIEAPLPHAIEAPLSRDAVLAAPRAVEPTSGGPRLPTAPMPPEARSADARSAER